MSEAQAKPSEMVERVVQAIFDAISATAMRSNELALQEGRIYFDGDFDARAVARAAAEAMREPTGVMIKAGEEVEMRSLCEGDPTADVPDEPAIWRAMIDAALSTGERG